MLIHFLRDATLESFFNAFEELIGILDLKTETIGEVWKYFTRLMELVTWKLIHSQVKGMTTLWNFSQISSGYVSKMNLHALIEKSIAI